MKRILVIDDQPDVVEMVVYMLQSEGYAAMGAIGGKAGLREARSFRPDLILCDIMMPGMSGFDVLKAMRLDVDLAVTPFVFLTARAAPEDLRAGMEMGADDYLTKPFSSEELISSIEAQLAKHAVRHARFEQKLAMLRQGLSTILPHELRTPLTLILAHSSLLMEAYDLFDTPTKLEYLGHIHESGLRLHRLIENLLLYVELEGDATLPLEHPGSSDTSDSIEAEARKQADFFGRTGDLKFNVQPGVLRMHSFHLQKVVAETVSNALKFSPKKTPVNVCAARDNYALVFTITDQGRGMTEEEIRSIEPYMQFNRSRLEQQGGGLGLAVAKRIVELYNGSLTIQSNPEEGTTVRVFIPEVWLDGSS